MPERRLTPARRATRARKATRAARKQRRAPRRPRRRPRNNSEVAVDFEAVSFGTASFLCPTFFPARIASSHHSQRLTHFHRDRNFCLANAFDLAALVITPEGEPMKKLATLVSALALAGSLALAQTAGDKTQEGLKKTTKAGATTTATKAKKGHKRGKKSKKGSAGATSGSSVPK